ncbi:hypothetical protein VNO78_15211 [Psophocarpus tetragonolobus]|uniref:Auxin efflux carrier component n=1 Tax=Psophocarpus tetragonolobus TaxID=3891 RepID=A0AAN9XJP3_PSOTE
MIGWEDVYKVVVQVVTLYVALMLGYGSLRWWKIFTKEQSDAINKLVCYFTLPLFIFQFTAHIDAFKMNFSFIAADTISKFIILLGLVLWAKCTTKGSFCWSITSFSLCNLTNALVVGVPMVTPMYGALGEGRGGKDVDATTVAIDVKEELMLEDTVSSRLPFRKLMKLVWLKFMMNPNSYGCVIGISWAFISNRDLYRSCQRPGLALPCLVWAAVPQSITSFIFAKEYGLHAEVLSTAFSGFIRVIFVKPEQPTICTMDVPLNVAE